MRDLPNINPTSTSDAESPDNFIPSSSFLLLTTFRPTTLLPPSPSSFKARSPTPNSSLSFPRLGEPPEEVDTGELDLSGDNDLRCLFNELGAVCIGVRNELEGEVKVGRFDDDEAGDEGLKPNEEGPGAVVRNAEGLGAANPKPRGDGRGAVGKGREGNGCCVRGWAIAGG
jgi:hypothetical protein